MLFAEFLKIPAKYEALDDDEAFKKAEEMFERIQRF